MESLPIMYTLLIDSHAPSNSMHGKPIGWAFNSFKFVPFQLCVVVVVYSQESDSNIWNFPSLKYRFQFLDPATIDFNSFNRKGDGAPNEFKFTHYKCQQRVEKINQKNATMPPANTRKNPKSPREQTGPCLFQSVSSLDHFHFLGTYF